MIPFAICGGRLHFSREDAVGERRVSDDSLEGAVGERRVSENRMNEWNDLEIRFLELGPDFCTFRVPVSLKEYMKCVDGVSLRFVLRKEKLYLTLGTSEFELSPVTEKEETDEEDGSHGLIRDFCLTYEIRIWNEQFREYSRRLTKDYLDYIEAKLSLSDAELAHYMTGTYPAEEDRFAASKQEQMELFRGKICDGYMKETWKWMEDKLSKELKDSIENKLLDRIEVALALETKKDCREWLRMGNDSFFMGRLEEYSLVSLKHPLTESECKTVFVGNAFCPLQCPEFSLVSEIMDVANELQLKLVLVMPPVSELMVEERKQYLADCIGYGKNIGLDVEVQMNDEGFYCWVKEAFSEIRVSRGVLLNKGKRDARMKYIGRSVSMCAADYETLYSGDDRQVSVINDIHLPWFQMNTGTFCPLHALICKGDRAASVRVRECPCFCDDRVILYPRYLNMMGRFNSIFGFDLEILTDGSVLERVLNGNTRIIIS